MSLAPRKKLHRLVFVRQRAIAGLAKSLRPVATIFSASVLLISGIVAVTSVAAVPGPILCSSISGVGPIVNQASFNDAIEKVNAGTCDTIDVSRDITFASAPDPIDVSTQSSLNTLTVTVIQADPPVDPPVRHTLGGGGEPGLEITLSGSQHLDISNLTFIDFVKTNSSGAALSIQGGNTVSIRNSVFNDNTVVSSGDYSSGGAIFISGAVSLNIESTYFARNTAEGSGGAIDFDSPGVSRDMTVLDSEFVDNRADGSGGAIRLRNGAQLNIEGATLFFRNHAGSQGTESISGVVGSGGAVSTDGPIVSSGAIYSGNSASAEGGAIATSASLESSDDNFSLNSATGYYVGSVLLSGKGGAVSAPTGFTGSDTTMSNNEAREHGGAVSACPFIDVGSIFHDNDAGERGGAINCTGSADDMSVSIDGTKFTDNEAGASGGAIYTDGSLTVSGDVPFTDSGTAKFDGNHSDENGGALAVVPLGSSETVDITGAIFENNSASRSGGAVQISGDTALSISDAHFGGPSKGNTAGENAGAIAISGAITAENTVFEGNESGSSVVNPDGGGAINAGGAVDLTSVTFKDNLARRGFGGAVYAASTFTARDSAFEENSTLDSGGNGGAVFSIGRVSVIESQFSSNSSAAAAGAIFVGNSVNRRDAEVEDSQFIGNEAVGQGGALLVVGNLTVTDSAFNLNRAGQSGGGASVDGAATVSRSTFRGNVVASGNGGAISVARLTALSSSFIENESSFGGGAAYVGLEAQITNSTFYANESTGPEGSAIQFDGALESATLSFSTFAESSTTGYPLIFLSDSDPSAARSISLIGSVLAPGRGKSCGWDGVGDMPLGTTTRNSFSTDDSCDSSGVTETTNSALDFSTLTTDVAPGQQVLVPGPASVLNSYAPFGSVTTDQLGALRNSSSGLTSAGAVQVRATSISGPQNSSVPPGADATFSVSAVPGVGTRASYQWQSSIDGGSWSNITGNLSAQTATLVLPGVTLADSGLKVRVNVTNTIGGAVTTSGAATLTVSVTPAPDPSPTNTIQPYVDGPEQSLTNQPNSQAPGTAGLLVNGREVPVSTKPGIRGGGLTLRAGPVALTLRSQTASGQRVPLAPDGSLILARSGEVPVSGGGLEPNSSVSMTLFSDPITLGYAPVGSGGSFTASPVIPSTVPVGAHTLQLTGRTKTGEPFVLSIGVLVSTPAAAVGANPVLTVQPKVVKPGASVAVMARGVQAGCRVTFTIAGERERTVASKKGVAQAHVMMPKRLPKNLVVKATVGGAKCSSVAVSKTLSR